MLLNSTAPLPGFCAVFGVCVCGGGGGGKVLLGSLNRLGAQGSGCGDAMCAECQHVTAGLGAYDVHSLVQCIHTWFLPGV